MLSILTHEVRCPRTLVLIAGRTAGFEHRRGPVSTRLRHGQVAAESCGSENYVMGAAMNEHRARDRSFS